MDEDSARFGQSADLIPEPACCTPYPMASCSPQMVCTDDCITLYGRAHSSRVPVTAQMVHRIIGTPVAQLVLFAAVGSIYKLLRIVGEWPSVLNQHIDYSALSVAACLTHSGLVCCVLGIISANNELEKAKIMSKEEAATFMVFNRLPFWLGVVEASMMATSIFLEVAGYATAATVCGALGVGK